MEVTPVPSGVSIRIESSTDVAAARRAVVQLAQAARLDNEQSSDASIVITEAATNVLKHGRGGEIILHRHGRRIEMAALDKGPGIANAVECFADGFSTVGTPGNGLGAISRLSTFRDIYSVPGQGTVLVAHLGETGKEGLLNVPYPGEQLCGDSWLIQSSPERHRLMIVDGLGHGMAAAEAAWAAIEIASNKSASGPENLLAMAHARLQATRGAAASVADIDASGRTCQFAGVGNVSGAIAMDAVTRRQMICVNGTLGHEVRKIQTWTYPVQKNALVILHSDGVSASWSLEKYPGLFTRHPSLIAAVLFRDFRRSRDDATILVMRVG